MLYISFDVGINNAAFCEATTQPGQRKLIITRWIRASISDNTVADTTQVEAVLGISEFLRHHFQDQNLASNPNLCILIERQVPLNQKAFVLSYVIMGYFAGLGISGDKIRMISPRKKPLPAELAGAKRKTATLVKPVVDGLLDTWIDNADECKALYETERKKDDLFDSFLQVMAVVGEHVAVRRRR